MKTTLKIIFQDAQDLKEIATESVDLVVTTPPYPIMIEIWDASFSNQNPEIRRALERGVCSCHREVPDARYPTKLQRISQSEHYRLQAGCPVAVVRFTSTALRSGLRYSVGADLRFE